MPWSTWTTRSPTFRSRRSERNVARRRAPALVARGAPLRRRRSRRRPAAPASGSRKPRESWPIADEHARPRARPRRARPARRRRRSRASSSIVRSARPGDAGDEQHRRRRARAPARISATQSCDAAAELQRRLTARRARTPVPLVDARARSQRRCARARAARRASSQSTAATAAGRRRRATARRGVARSSASTCSRSFAPLRVDLVAARTRRRGAGRRRSRGTSTIDRRARPRRHSSAELAQRHDRRPDRSARSIAASPGRKRRIDSTVSPMNSSADRLRVAGGKEVDDAAADAELAVLVDRILAREAGVDEQLAEVVRRDLVPGPEHRSTAREQPLRRADARQQRRRRGDDQRAPCPAASACSARARAEATSKCGVDARGTDRPRATETAGPTRSTSASDAALRARRGRSARRRSVCSTSRVGRHDEQRRPPARARPPRPRASALRGRRRARRRCRRAGESQRAAA